MPPRKGHKKSRNGCTACKKRRVKCDEGQPNCGNCIRRGIQAECTYLRILKVAVRHDDEVNEITQSSIVEESSPPQRGFSSEISEEVTEAAPEGHCVCGYFHPYPTRSTPILDEYPGGLPVCALVYGLATPGNYGMENPSSGHYISHSSSNNGLSLTDVSLFHHFVTTTSRTMTISPYREVWETWTDAVDRLANSHSFVMEAVLAVAAAHIDTEESNTMADYHFREAFRRLQIELAGNTKKAINSRNCHGLFMTLNMFLLYALSGRTYKVFGTDGVYTRPYLDTSWTVFLRSAVGVLVQSWPWITTGPIASLFSCIPPIPGIRTSFSCRTEAMFANLNRLCTDGSIDGASEELGNVNTATAYFAAIWNIKKIWSVVEEVVGIPPSGSDATVAFSSSSTKPPATIANICNLIYHFALRTPRPFWEALQKKKPRALTIYAYFSVCWEAFHYACRLKSLETGLLSDANKGSTLFWVSGRAEVDLKGVEAELRFSGNWDVWNTWIAGAWMVFDGLKAGWWFDQAVEPLNDTLRTAMVGNEMMPLQAANAWGTLISVEKLQRWH
ncbi:hypothetical protein CPC08DRAFT_730923 [Agrocybe pediades]|nr:hypothetical protein CPC08DRAFT_730923 [Agrocybe pediades]